MALRDIIFQQMHSQPAGLIECSFSNLNGSNLLLSNTTMTKKKKRFKILLLAMG